MRARKWYSPPERGSAAESSAYATPPQKAHTPPTSQSTRTTNGVRPALIWNPTLVKTPVPIILATTRHVAVKSDIEPDGAFDIAGKGFAARSVRRAGKRT